MIPKDKHEQFRSLMESSRRLVLTTHMNPDGDALGSEIGLQRLLMGQGREIRIINHDATPEFLRFLEDPSNPVEVYEAGRHDSVLAGADLVVLLDNSAPDRLAGMEQVIETSAERVLCIDHHPTRATPWTYNILDEEACATAAMVYDLAQERGWKPDFFGAQALYVGLATDTGFFRFNSTAPRSHEIAAELLKLGVDPARCYQEVCERNPPALTRLQGHALAGMRLDAGGAVASIRITREMVATCNATNVDTSDMTTALLATDGVRMALLLREMDDGRIKVSLRSKGDLDVHKLASQFGGGGHRNASGIVLQGSIAEIEDQVIRKAADLLAGRL